MGNNSSLEMGAPGQPAENTSRPFENRPENHNLEHLNRNLFNAAYTQERTALGSEKAAASGTGVRVEKGLSDRSGKGAGEQLDFGSSIYPDSLASAHGEKKLSKSELETGKITRESDHHLSKTYTNGDQVSVKGEGLVATDLGPGGVGKIEQHKAPLKELTADELARVAANAAHDKNGKIVTGKDGVAVFKVNEQDGSVVAKNSKDAGATIRLKDGSMFQARDGKVFALDGQGNEREMGKDELPAEIQPGKERNSLQVGSVSLTADNSYSDSANNLKMDDRSPVITAQTVNGPITVDNQDGQSTITTQDRTYAYDNGTGNFNVLNADGSTDLTYNDAFSTLSTDGATYDTGSSAGDGSELSNQLAVAKAQQEDSENSPQSKDQEKIQTEQTLAVVEADAYISKSDDNVDALEGDLAELASMRTGASPTVEKEITHEEAVIENALAAVTQHVDSTPGAPGAPGTPQAMDAELAGQFAGNGSSSQNSLTLPSGASNSNTDYIRTYGLPPIELFDSGSIAA